MNAKTSAGLFCRAFYIMVAILAFSSVGQAQMPSFKGHVMDETITQFMTNSYGLKLQLGLCLELKNPKSARRAGLDWNACQGLISAVKSQGQVVVSDGCLGFYTLANLPTTPCLEFSGEVTFADGKLSVLKLELSQPWNDVLEDLVGKLGTPTRTGRDTFQNGYGASFFGSTAVWIRDAYSLTAIEKVEANPYGGGPLRRVIIRCETQEALTKSAAQAAQRKSTLD